ncbi:MAG: NADP-dependent oxidoreductase [Myxococcales bacterium]|nr:NADP-dependent oxidoreductase [Myxococcales bacterium]
MAGRNRQIVLARRPVGTPVVEDFALRDAPMPSPGAGQVLLRHLYLSLDPAIRGWMSEARSYLPPIAIGAPVRSGTLSEVVESNLPAWPTGTLVQALAAWEEHSVVGKDALLGRIEPSPDIPLATMLSVLGGNGLTAYFGLFDVGQPKPGETVLVSAAAGGVGSVVGQLARRHGCRAVGLTSTPDKCAFLTDELGYDAAIPYKAYEPGAPLSRAIKDACPAGVDVFFDSVGGPILDAALSRLNVGARVALCGAISQINATEPPPGPRNYLQLLAKRARMQGFITLDFAARYDEARRHLREAILDGSLRYRDDIVEGLENAPAHLLRLFSGDHVGKLMVHLADPSTPAKHRTSTEQG